MNRAEIAPRPPADLDDGIIDDDELARLQAAGVVGRLPDGPTPVRKGVVLAILARVALGPKRGARVPPHDLSAEASVLAYVIAVPSMLACVTRIVKSAHFYSDAHRRIFEACVELRAAGLAGDVVAVATWLRDREELVAVGGMARLVEILQAPLATRRKVLAHTRAIRERARARVLIARRGRP
jgi:hypothetical protein